MLSLPQMTPRTEIIISIVAYSLCSGSLVLINKLILHLLPFPSLVIAFQLMAAILFIVIASYTGLIECDPLRWKFVFPYLAYTVAFSLGVYCNMKSLQFSNVETVIVFRALAPCVVSVLDVMFLGREYPSTRSWSGLSLIVLGAYGYAVTDPKFQAQGISAYSWPTLYLVVISFEMAYGKKIIRSVDLKTKSGPVLYTNLLGFPPMLLFAKMGNEFNKFWENMWIEDNVRLPLGSIPLLLLGCVVGTGIGYSSWWCRDKVSATSFTLIGVMNKCLTVLANLLIWDNHAPPMGIASLFLCLVGGSLYKQAPLRVSNRQMPRDILTKDEEGVWDSEVSAVEAATDEETEVLHSNNNSSHNDNMKRRG
mmetsp:Transcript_6570/g.11443  ORF Transcript_6570/g.11443 Transcript_6570/m.11443 type:complete len:365 (-) Transcript_6570:40-1134(-)